MRENWLTATVHESLLKRATNARRLIPIRTYLKGRGKFIVIPRLFVYQYLLLADPKTSH